MSATLGGPTHTSVPVFSAKESVLLRVENLPTCTVDALLLSLTYRTVRAGRATGYRVRLYKVSVTGIPGCGTSKHDINYKFTAGLD